MSIEKAPTPEEIKQQLPNVLSNAKKLLDTNHARGVLVIVFMDNGDAVEASDTRLCSFYEPIGALEAVKSRMLRPKGS